MNRRQLRVRMLLEEARLLGVDVADLIAAHSTAGDAPITLAGWVAETAPTFTPATASTYRPYWRLSTELLGHRRLIDILLSE